jgi:ABC-type multidrug transport system ATPase subunit
MRNCGYKAKMQISFKDICVERSGHHAVNKADGSFMAGCWNGIIGANGSGKTSLLRALAGRLPLAAGHLWIDGKDVTNQRIWRAQNIGFSPDIAALPKSLSGRHYFGLVQQSAQKNADAQALALLKQALDFASFVDDPIGSLSSGMKQRLALYSAFMTGDRIVFLDEPFNWLDPVCAFETKKALRTLVTKYHYTLVTALHEMSVLALVCDHGLIMHSGSVVSTLSTQALRQGAQDIAQFEADLIARLR